MKIVDYSLKNRTTILFIMFLILVGGIAAYDRMGKLEDPEFTIKTALVITPYPGASAYEVEQQVTRVIEEAVQATEEVEKIRSISRPGSSLVYVDFYERNRSDAIEQLWDILRRRVQAAQASLPPGAGASVVHDDYSQVYGIFLALTGDGFEYAELKYYADFIKRELMLVKDVERIVLFGSRTESIIIDINRAKCAGYGISPLRIVEALKSQNQVLPAGSLEIGDRRIRLDASGDFDSPGKIGELVIQGREGGQVFLKDLAEIRRTYLEPPEPTMRMNGLPAIGIAISTASGGNVVEMGDAVEKRIQELMVRLPIGLNLDGVYYQSRFVKKAIGQFMTNLAESVAIVVAVLLISMGLRSGLIIAANLLLSILATLVVMLAWGIDLQKISLGALILVMGMIVDNAIVVADGALVRSRMGFSRMDAVALPARQTAWPLLGATAIACLAFLPIYLAPTNAGEFCASLFLVVSMALGISWLLAMSQTPVFCYYFLSSPKKAEQSEIYRGRVFGVYRRVLNLALRFRLATMLILAVVLALGVVGFRRVPKMFFADSDKAQFFIDYRLPEGARIQKLSRDLGMVEAYLGKLPQVRNYATCLGSSPPRFAASVTPEPQSPSFGQIVVNVHDYLDIDMLIGKMETFFREKLPDGEAHIWKYISGPKADYKVEARFTGPDPAVLRKLADKAKEIMAKEPLAKCVTDDWRQPVMVWEAAYSQKRGREAGVERLHLAAALASLNDGMTVTHYREADDLIPVKVRYGEMDPANMGSTPIWGGGPQAVPLEQVVTKGGLTWEDPIVMRYNRRRVIRAQCDTIAGVTSGTLLAKVRPAIEAIELPPGYVLEWEGEHELSEKGNQGVQTFFPLALVCMVMILVALFNALRQPLIIMLTVPLAMVGMTVGLLVFNEPFGFLALLGAYSLVGMLIKNAVVLIDQIDLEIKDGKDALQAVKDSAISRMRPVLMASGTTILGMIPLVTDAMFSSMAVTIMFGLAFGTVLTLIVVPVVYTLLFRIRTRP